MQLPFPLNTMSTIPLDPTRLDDTTLLALVIFGEAEGESDEGKRAVGCVVRNRVNQGGWWGNTYKQVMLKTKQFSCLNEDYRSQLVARLRGGVQDPYVFRKWADSYFIAIRVYYTDPWGGSLLSDNTNGATHYHTKQVSPGWASGVKPCATMGNHLFYKGIK